MVITILYNDYIRSREAERMKTTIVAGYKIHHRVEMVPVADDRGEVKGATVIIEGMEASIIPPEGDSLDCWLGPDGEDMILSFRD